MYVVTKVLRWESICLKVEKKTISCKIYSEYHYLEPLAHGDSKYLIPA